MIQKFYLSLAFMGIAFSTLLAQSEKPVVAVMEFDMAARRAYRELGTGLSDMLTNALVENGNFRVVERKRLVEIQQEQQIGLSGAIDPATSASIGRLVGAGYLVMGTITEFKENESGGVAGAFLRQSGVGVGMFQSHIGFTVRIVNATTGEIVASKSVDKKVTKVGLAGGSLYGLPAGGIGYKSQAMEDAVEQALKETVEIIAQNLSVFDNNPASTAYTEGYDAKTACANFNPASAPKIMVVIPEVHLSGKVPDPAGETEIIKQLVELGFNVVDQQQIAMIREQERVTNAINDPMAAASLGVEFGADVIIVGEAFSEFAGRNNNMISCRARVEARAIHTRTGRILATDGHHGSGMDISENLAGKTALKNAGSTLGNYLISQLCEKYDESSPVTTISAIEIMASNVDFMTLKKLTDYLASVRGVSNVQKSMTGNVGRINLQYSGAIDKLAEEILSKTSLGFDITGFSDNKLEMAAR